MTRGNKTRRRSDTEDSLGIDSVKVEWRMDTDDLRIYHRDSRQDTEGGHWFRNFPIRFNPNNHTAYITIHLANVLWKKNHKSVTFSELEKAIRKAEKELELPISRFRLIGVHIAGTIRLRRKTIHYLPFINLSGMYKPEFIYGPNDNSVTLYSNSRRTNTKSDVTRIIYEKDVEDKKTGKLRRRTRFELRIHRHLRKHLHLGEKHLTLELRDIYEPEVYRSLLFTWFNGFRKFIPNE